MPFKEVTMPLLPAAAVPAIFAVASKISFEFLDLLLVREALLGHGLLEHLGLPPGCDEVVESVRGNLSEMRRVRDLDTPFAVLLHDFDEPPYKIAASLGYWCLLAGPPCTVVLGPAG
jgi:hypothetical protein